MRKYKEELVARLQNDSKAVMEDGVEFIVKPIPEIEKTSGMDPRMLKAAKEKIKKYRYRVPTLNENIQPERSYFSVRAYCSLQCPRN